jgi:hypothetical protein
MARRFLLPIAALLLGLFADASRADFESDLLRKFQKQNQATADQLKQEAARLLAQGTASSQNPAQDLQRLQKLIGQLQDDTRLPREERTTLVRKLREHAGHYKRLLDARMPPAQAASDGLAATARPPAHPIAGFSSTGNAKALAGVGATIITGGTTATVPDGGTRVFSSVGAVSEGRNEAGVPLLGKVPYLDRGYRNVGQGRTVTGAQINISVRIISMEEEEARFLKGK